MNRLKKMINDFRWKHANSVDRFKMVMKVAKSRYINGFHHMIKGGKFCYSKIWLYEGTWAAI